MLSPSLRHRGPQSLSSTLTALVRRVAFAFGSGFRLRLSRFRLSRVPTAATPSNYHRSKCATTSPVRRRCVNARLTPVLFS